MNRKNRMTILGFVLYLAAVAWNQNAHADRGPYTPADATIDTYLCVGFALDVVRPTSNQGWRRVAEACRLAVELQGVEWSNVWAFSFNEAGRAYPEESK